MNRQFNTQVTARNHNRVGCLKNGVKNIDRSFAEARRLVRDIDQASLAQKRPVTRSFVAEILKR